VSEHLSTQTVERYSRRTLSPAELLAAGDHLAICEVCRHHAITAMGADSILSSVRTNLRAEAANHVSYEQIAALIDGELQAADREVVESHLEICALCAGEVSDLRTFRSSIATAPERPVVTPAPATLRERLSSLWRSSASWTPRVATASAVVLLLILVTGALVLVWKTRSERQTEVTTIQGSTEPSGAPSPGLEGTPQTSPPAVEDKNGAADDSSVEVALNDAGGRVTLDKRGNITGLDAFSSSSRSVVSKALIAERVEQSPVLAELSGRAGTLLGDQGHSPDLLLSPVGTVVRNERPRFRWRPLTGASSYTVNVLDSNFNVVATSPPLTVTTWTPPSALARGVIFSWQLTAVKDGQKVLSPTAPSPEARFKILEMEKAVELRRAESASPASHLTLGVLYARAGLLDDSERELRALVAANPQSATARKLLRSVEAEKNKRTNTK
jgi:hypothetical protein